MTQLSGELHELTASIRQETPPQLQYILQQCIEHLRRQQFAAHNLGVGEAAPDVTLTDQHKQPIRLYEQLQRGPVTLAFFRGGWCPYCNLTLQAWRYAWPDIVLLGGRLLAVTPENPAHIRRTVQKNKLDFPVLYDCNSEVAREFGISVALSAYITAFYRSLGLNISLRNADVIARLPLPATYVIDRQGIIRYAFVEADYTQRAEIADVLRILKQVQTENVPSYPRTLQPV